MKKRLSISRFTIFFILLIVALVAARAVLPELVKTRINHTLAHDLEEYTGAIEDFDLLLIAGTYFIEGLHLRRKSAPPNENLVMVKKMEMDLSWRALLNGRLLLDLKLHEPTLNFFDAVAGEKKQTGAEEENWQNAMDSFFPLQLQTIEVRDGTLRFSKTDASPRVDAVLDQLNISLRDILDLGRKEKDKLVSSFELTGRAQGHARVALKGRARILEEPRLVRLDADVDSFRLKTLNPFFQAYGYFDVTSGILSTKGNVKMTGNDADILFDVRMQAIDVIAPKQKYKGARGLFTEVILAMVNWVSKDPTQVVDTELHVSGRWPDLKLDQWRAIRTFIQSPQGGTHEKDIHKDAGDRATHFRNERVRI